MASKRVTRIIVFNVLTAFFLLLSSQFVLYAIEQRREVVGEIGLIIDTHYAGPIELTPTYARSDILNLPIIIFIITIVGNAILVVSPKRENTKMNSYEQSKVED
jgi:hypothetical protein